MRNYWLRIVLGAAAVFTVGMIGVTLARQGVGHVRGVVAGSGPISFPLPFVSFNLDGQKLGKVSRVVLHRTAPKQIAGVELEIRLDDSVVARGLEGCRLAANFDDDPHPEGPPGAARKFSRGVFTCLPNDTALTPAKFEEFGHAVFQPGDVSVPLLLPADVVTDLKEGDLDPGEQDSTALAVELAAEAAADSVADAAEARADSIADAAEQKADSIVAASRHLIDSLRREGLRRADSARRVVNRLADSLPRR
jgi:hypothetical protein